MPSLRFTSNIQRHVRCPDTDVVGDTVRSCLEAFFQVVPEARSYILTDQAALRKHMSIFVNNIQIQDREQLSDSVANTDEIFILQALSGG